MSNSSDRPLRKVTMNFYADDIAYLERVYGPGWTEQVRIWTNERCRLREKAQDFMKQLDKRLERSPRRG